MRPLKILYHHRVASQDGQSVHIAEMVAAFQALGHEIHMVGPSVRPAEFGKDSWFLPLLRRIVPAFVLELMELLYAVRAYHKLRKAAKSFKPDILYERHNLFLPAGRWFRQKTGLPYIVEVNAPLADERAKFSGLALQSLARREEIKSWRAADQVLPVSRQLADILIKEGVRADAITVVHNGIDLESYEHLDAAPVRTRFDLQGKTVLGFTGFVREWHRLDRIIRLIARDTGPDAPHLLIVGDGPAIPDCKDLADTLGVMDRVHFAGFVDRHDIPAHLAAMDIALQPAVTPYASPLKLFEYMAAGLATVAPAQPNILEILTDGKDSLLFPPDDFDTAERQILALVADKDMRTRLGACARTKIIETPYTWAGNAARVTDIAWRLIDKAKG